MCCNAKIFNDFELMLCDTGGALFRKSNWLWYDPSVLKKIGSLHISATVLGLHISFPVISN